MTGDRPDLPVSRFLRGIPDYPFAHLDELRRQVEATGIEVIDLGIGDPRGTTPGFIKQALIEALPVTDTYPRVVGIAELRAAATTWVQRRFRVDLDPDRHVLPTSGAKEAIFHLPLAVLDLERQPVSLIPDPAYPVYRLATEALGGESHFLPLLAGNRFLPDLSAIPSSTWDRTSILWINYPNNPTGAMATREFLQEAVERCRRHGALLVSDEAYCETYFDVPPAGALQFGTENVLALFSLSKRSAMPGYRSGFMAGDERVIAALKKLRPGLGVASPVFIQRAAVAAWSDEDHVGEIREQFRRRRDLARDSLQKAGYAVPEATATFFLWIPVPAGQTSTTFCEAALQAGVVLLPGSALGEAGEGYVRLSVGVEEDLLAEALARLGTLSV